MDYNVNASNAWNGYIRDISCNFVTLELLEILPIPSLIKFVTKVPIDSIDKEYLHLGQCFNLYEIDGKLKFIWQKNEPLTKENKEKLDNEISGLNILWD